MLFVISFQFCVGVSVCVSSRISSAPVKFQIDLSACAPGRNTGVIRTYIEATILTSHDILKIIEAPRCVLLLFF